MVFGLSFIDGWLDTGFLGSIFLELELGLFVILVRMGILGMNPFNCSLRLLLLGFIGY